MNEISESRRRAFLEELTALTIKHRISIGGCGCCQSPFLVETKRAGRYCSAIGIGDPEVKFEEFETADEVKEKAIMEQLDRTLELVAIGQKLIEERHYREGQPEHDDYGKVLTKQDAGK